MEGPGSATIKELNFSKAHRERGNSFEQKQQNYE